MEPSYQRQDKHRREKLRRLLLLVVLGLAFVAMAGILGWHALVSDLCDNVVQSSVSSPDGALKAVAFSRECGATVASSTHILVMNSNDSLSDTAVGSIVVDDISHDPSIPLDVTLKWTDRRTLEVTKNLRAHLSRNPERLNVLGLMRSESVQVLYKDSIEDKR